MLVSLDGGAAPLLGPADGEDRALSVQGLAVSTEVHKVRPSLQKPASHEGGRAGVVLYASRWWILGSFAMLACIQCVVWIFYGPIADEAKAFYGWGDSDISLQEAWGTIFFFPVAAATPWLAVRIGIRRLVLLTAAMTVIGAWLRCVKTSSSGFTNAAINIGSIINAANGPMVMGLPPRLSALWFQADFRTTSTAVMALANTSGIIFGFGIGLAVDDKDQVLPAAIIVASVCSALFVTLIIYFPERPPTPPSISAGTQDRPKLLAATKALFHNRTFLILANIYGLTTGVYSAFTGILPDIVEPLGFSQRQAAVMGSLATFVGILGGLLVGRLADRLHRLRSFLLSMLLGAVFAACFFALVCNRVILAHYLESNRTLKISLVYTSFAFVGLFVNAAVPLFYEMAAECTFPISEEVSATFLASINNLACLAFLVGGDKFPSKTENWIMVSSCVIGLLLVTLVREERRRAAVDEQNKESDDDESALLQGFDTSSSPKEAIVTSSSSGQSSEGEEGASTLIE